VRVEMGLVEGRRSSFKQSDPRALLTLKKYITKMVDDIPDAVALM
jgi:hypothetical protein